MLAVLAQWQMGRAWLAHASRVGLPAVWARALLGTYYAVVAAGVAIGLPAIAGPLGINRWVSALLGGATYLWAYTSTAVYLVYALVGWVLRRFFAAPFDPARRRLLNAVSGALAASPLVVVGYGALVERTSFRVHEVEVPIPSLPRDLDGLRLVQLSDIHLSAFLSEGELARAIDAANQTRAHVALVTGDLISMQGDPLDACLRQIARLRAEAGILGCMGNHEEYAHAKEYALKEGSRLGVRFLRFETQQLRFGSATLNFAGVDYQPLWRKGRYLAGAERLTIPGAVNVLLSHNPDVFPVAARKGFDLTLAGHTHGGQVTVEILNQTLNPARFLTPYVYGLYREGGKSVYVTRGIGTIGIPARLGAPPEITLLRLRRV